MSLAPGARLGSYEIVALIGAGGMGEVYRARDGKLTRDVALKIRPSFLAGDPERRARFTREANLLATLNHPNIAAIYGFEPSDPSPALVLEMVEGPTLADRLEGGPVPIEETLMIARQMAEALEAAHAQGIVLTCTQTSPPPGTVTFRAATASAFLSSLARCRRRPDACDFELDRRHPVSAAVG